MITVEELIVRSLYHRLVLIRVRRTREPQANPGDGDDMAVVQTGGSRLSPNDEAGPSPAEGLGNNNRLIGI